MARRTKRERRLRASVVWTVLGLAVVTAVGVWLDRARDTDLQDPTAGVSAEFMHAAPSNAPDLEFADVAGRLGVDSVLGPGPRGRTLPEDTGSGIAWGDYDGDGDDDLYLPGFPGPLGTGPVEGAGGNRLYRNDGGTFVDVTETAGVGDLEGFGMGGFFADLDGDADLDLYVTNFGANRLFRNRGTGVFEEVAAKLGVADGRWSVGAAFADYDRDGRLDIYVTNYVEYDAEAAIDLAAPADPSWEGVPYSLNPNAFDPVSNSLYRQRANGTFEEIALELGASNPAGRSLGATFVDLEGDGWLDLYVANDVSANVLLRNVGADLGAAMFEDVSSRTGTADPRGSMGISVADLRMDGPSDGLPDLFVTHWVAQENALYEAVEESGRFEYRDRVRNYRLAEVSTDRVGWGSAFVDLDLDGRLDIVVANGSTLEESPAELQAQPPFFFWNDGARFHDSVAAWGEGLARPLVARGLAVSDFDRDGDPDIAISVNRDRPLVLESTGSPRGRWLGVKLAGPAAETAGARVRVESDSTETTRWMGADVSFASMHSAELLYGLGEDSSASIDVRFASGGRRRLEGVPAGFRVVLL